MHEALSRSILCCEECEYCGRFTICNFSTAAREQLQSIGIQAACFENNPVSGGRPRIDL